MSNTKRRKEMTVFVNKEKCTVCNICLNICPFDGIDMIENFAVINEKCRGCGSCLSVCPFEAITMDWSTDENTY
jgi:electron transfer flavoprotein alpha subunit